MRLIDIDPITEKLKNAIYLGKRIGADTDDLEAVLADIEAADPKKGKWLRLGGGWACCSVCENVERAAGLRWRHCPNCGSRMEGNDET